MAAVSASVPENGLFKDMVSTHKHLNMLLQDILEGIRDIRIIRVRHGRELQNIMDGLAKMEESQSEALMMDYIDKITAWAEELPPENIPEFREVFDRAFEKAEGDIGIMKTELTRAISVSDLPYTLKESIINIVANADQGLEIYTLDPAVANSVTAKAAIAGIPVASFERESDGKMCLIPFPGYEKALEKLIDIYTLNMNGALLNTRADLDEAIRMFRLSNTERGENEMVSSMKGLNKDQAELLLERLRTRDQVLCCVEKDEVTGTYSLYYDPKQAQTVYAEIMNVSLSLSSPFASELIAQADAAQEAEDKAMRYIAKHMKGDDGGHGAYIFDADNPDRFIHITPSGYEVVNADGSCEAQDTRRPSAPPDLAQEYENGLKRTFRLFATHPVYVSEADTQKNGLARINGQNVGELSKSFKQYIYSKSCPANIDKKSDAYKLYTATKDLIQYELKHMLKNSDQKYESFQALITALSSEKVIDKALRDYEAEYKKLEDKDELAYRSHKSRHDILKMVGNNTTQTTNSNGKEPILSEINKIKASLKSIYEDKTHIQSPFIFSDATNTPENAATIEQKLKSLYTSLDIAVAQANDAQAERESGKDRSMLGSNKKDTQKEGTKSDSRQESTPEAKNKEYYENMYDTFCEQRKEAAEKAIAAGTIKSVPVKSIETQAMAFVITKNAVDRLSDNTVYALNGSDKVMKRLMNEMVNSGLTINGEPISLLDFNANTKSVMDGFRSEHPKEFGAICDKTVEACYQDAIAAERSASQAR